MSSRSEYDSFARYYDDFKGDDNYPLFYSILMDRILKPASFDPQDRRVLEVGCGTGAFSQLFANDGADATGIDISTRMVSVAEKKHPDAAFAVGDISDEGFPIPARPFDLAVALDDVINCLPDSASIERAFSNVRRTLSDNAYFLFDLVTLDAFRSYMGSVCYRQERDAHFLTYPLFPLEAGYRGPFSMACISIAHEADSRRLIKEDYVLTEYWYPDSAIDRLLETAAFSIVAKRGLTSEGSLLDVSNGRVEHINKIIYLCRKEVKNEHHRGRKAS